MMLAITIEDAVRKPMVRMGGAAFIAARWVNVVIRQECYSTFLLIILRPSNVEKARRVLEEL